MTRSHNTHDRDKQKKFNKIFEALGNAEEGLFPKSISSLTGLNYSTVRSYLRELLVKGKVGREYVGGPYHLVANRTHRVQNINIHNLIYSHKIMDDVTVQTSDREHKIMLNKASLRITVGKSNRLVTGQLSSEITLTLKEAILIGDIFREQIRTELGYLPKYDAIDVKTVEFNWDYLGLRIDGANCITLHCLGALERAYNKGKVLRYEVKPRPFTIKELLDLLEGGIDYATNMDRLHEIEERLDKMHELMSRIGKSLFFIKRQGERDEEKGQVG